MIGSLSKALAYSNDEVVHRFSSDFDLPLIDAQEIFTETKRWLWLCARQAEQVKQGKAVPVSIPLLSEVQMVDLMWHTFLLFTADYAQFCQEHFGFFIHHSPQTRADRELWQKQMRTDPEAAMLLRRKSLRAVYEYIHDELGPEVLMRWCEEYPQRFRRQGH